DSETVDFLKAISYLSYTVMNSDACILTGFLENDRAKKKLYISFRHHGIKVEKKRLDTFEIAEYAEDGYGLGGSGMEVQFADCPLVEFLGAIHSHISTKNESLSKNKLLEGLPYLCGLSSEDESDGQKIVALYLETLTGMSSESSRKPQHYLDSLSRLWEETQLVFLTCAYEARLKKIQIFPPPDNSKVINLGLTKLHHHELICLAWYLANLDGERVNIEVLMLQDCDIDDDGLKLL
ncbi:Si:ch211214b163, partial [Caligus rogercresseyi]